MAITFGDGPPEMSEGLKRAWQIRIHERQVRHSIHSQQRHPASRRRRAWWAIKWRWRDAREWLGFKIAGYDPREDW